MKPNYNDYKMFIYNSCTYPSSHVELDIVLSDEEYNDLPNTPLFTNDSVTVVIRKANEKNAVQYSINPYLGYFQECSPEDLKSNLEEAGRRYRNQKSK
tara:strand:+ start:2138 stop:2431 length:294 start_codon:yes stop_codon:yes gene_type:complete